MLAPGLLGQASGAPVPMYCSRMAASPHAQAPWCVTPPMIPNPELGQPSNGGGGPPSAQRAIAEFLAQPNQVSWLCRVTQGHLAACPAAHAWLLRRGC